jgi:hypothetical protein
LHGPSIQKLDDHFAIEASGHAFQERPQRSDRRSFFTQDPSTIFFVHPEEEQIDSFGLNSIDPNRIWVVYQRADEKEAEAIEH